MLEFTFWKGRDDFCEEKKKKDEERGRHARSESQFTHSPWHLFMIISDRESLLGFLIKSQYLGLINDPGMLWVLVASHHRPEGGTDTVEQ